MPQRQESWRVQGAFNHWRATDGRKITGHSGQWSFDGRVIRFLRSMTFAKMYAGLALLLLGMAVAALAVPAPPAAPREPRPAAPPAESPADSLGAPWGRMPVTKGGPVDMRPFPPRAGRNRCIGVNNVAGAQLFGDRAIELTMRDGRRFRMFFARECQALSFYQGFYYRRLKAGQLCAGRDVIGARSGGECSIASIIPVRRFNH